MGVGVITNLATDFPGYTGSIPTSAALVSEVLRENGYATAAFGKWHLIPENEAAPSGEEIREKLVNKPRKGHFAKAGTTLKKNS